MQIFPADITPLNPLLDKVNEWTHSDSTFKKHFLARLVSLVAGPPLAAISSLYNAACFVGKTPIVLAKFTFGLIPIKKDGHWVMNGSLWKDSLGFKEWMKHAYKAAAFALDIIFCPLMGGIISPSANIWVHEKLGLIIIDRNDDGRRNSLERPLLPDLPPDPVLQPDPQSALKPEPQPQPNNPSFPQLPVVLQQPIQNADQPMRPSHRLETSPAAQIIPPSFQPAANANSPISPSEQVDHNPPAAIIVPSIPEPLAQPNPAQVNQPDPVPALANDPQSNPAANAGLLNAIHGFDPAALRRVQVPQQPPAANPPAQSRNEVERNLRLLRIRKANAQNDAEEERVVEQIRILEAQLRQMPEDANPVPAAPQSPQPQRFHGFPPLPPPGGPSVLPSAPSAVPLHNQEGRADLMNAIQGFNPAGLRRAQGVNPQPAVAVPVANANPPVSLADRLAQQIQAAGLLGTAEPTDNSSDDAAWQA